MATTALQHELATMLRDLEATRYLAVAGFAAMIYDHFLTLPDEVDLIWRNPSKPVSTLFLFNRYLIPIIMVIDFYDKLGFTTSIPISFCKSWFFIEGLLQTICFANTHVLVALRVRALYSNRPAVEWVLLIGGVLYFAATMVFTFLSDFAVDDTIVYNPIIHVCYPSDVPRWAYWTWIPALMYEFLLFCLTIGKAIDHRRRHVTMPVAEMLYRDGFLYFCVIATCSVFNILVWAALRPSLVALAKYFTFCFVNCMCSRLVLNLRSLRRQPKDWGIPSSTQMLELQDYPLSPMSPGSGAGFGTSSKRSSQRPLTGGPKRVTAVDGFGTKSETYRIANNAPRTIDFTLLSANKYPDDKYTRPPRPAYARHSRNVSVVRKGSVGGVEEDLEIGPGAERDATRSRLGFVPRPADAHVAVHVDVDVDVSVEGLSSRRSTGSLTDIHFGLAY